MYMGFYKMKNKNLKIFAIGTITSKINSLGNRNWPTPCFMRAAMFEGFDKW